MLEYISFDMEYLIDFYTTVRSGIGVIATVAFFAFILVLSVYVILDVIRQFS